MFDDELMTPDQWLLLRDLRNLLVQVADANDTAAHGFNDWADREWQVIHREFETLLAQDADWFAKLLPKLYIDIANTVLPTQSWSLHLAQVNDLLRYAPLLEPMAPAESPVEALPIVELADES